MHKSHSPLELGFASKMNFTSLSDRSCRRPARRRQAQALAEFAILLFLFVMLVTGLIGFGVMLVQTNMTSSVALSASMLCDQMIPASEDLTIEEVYAQLREKNLFNESQLILSPSDFQNQTFQGGPLASLNRKMLGLYQYDRDYDVYRYPGAITTHNGEDTVLIPIVERTSSETITAWYKPVELEFDENNPNVVHVMVSMASQPGSLVSYQLDSNGDTFGAPIAADDVAVNQSAAMPEGYTLKIDPTVVPTPTDSFANSNRGAYGLGESYVFERKVRPFRRVFAHGGAFRLIPMDGE